MELQIKQGLQEILISPKRKERYNYFLPFYSEESIEVVQLLSSKGDNSFASMQRKLNLILHASFAKKEYNNALYEAFEMHNPYTPDEIIQEVSQVRSSLGLEPYHNVKASSLDDFLNLFMVERVTDEETKRKLIAYKPVFRIKPE